MIFCSEQLNTELEHKGYVVLPFFSAEQVAELKQLYGKYESESPYFHSTTFSKDVATKQRLNEEAEVVFNPKVEELFTGYKNLGASFLTKPAGQGGHMPVHQDWTIVDESKYGSYTIWVPLQDVNEENGAITVLDGSHRLSATLRSPGLPAVINAIEPEVRKRMKTLRMKAGEAFIFNHALLHASHLNTSGTNRLAITYGLIPDAAQLLFYYQNANGMVDKYEVDDNFFLHYDNHGSTPSFVQPVAQIEQDFTPISVAAFQAFCAAYKTANMKPIFKDAALQKQYDTDGYVLIDLLNADEVADLKSYYGTLDNNHIPSYGFHVSLDNNNTDFVTKVMDKIKTTITPKADEVFDNYKIFTTSYVVKEPNPVSVVPPHQDWNFTDEDAGYGSATVWTALVDTDMMNGAMGVIVGSHKFFDHHRASPAPQFKTPLDSHVFSIFPYLKLLPMKAGQALIFDNRTVHASPPNVSNDVRLAVGFGVTQKDAPMRHFYLQPGSDGKKLNEYEVDDYFFSHFNNGSLRALYEQGKQPEGLKLLGTVDNRVTEISADELTAKIKAAGNTFNVEMCEHLAKLFNYNMDGSQKEEPKQEEAKPVEAEPVHIQHTEDVWVDDRSFFQKYTPLNIVREIKKRVLAN